MKLTKKKTAALALAATFALSALSGCALVTSNLTKNLAQEILTVDITKSEKFADGGVFAKYGTKQEYRDAIVGESKVLKRDVVANYASYGSSYVNSGYTEQAAYETIINTLVNRQIFLQYAKVYFFEHDGTKNIDDYISYVAAAKGKANEAVAEYDYFLDEDEIAMAEYALKTTFNATLDSQETALIEAEADEHDHDVARTTPTGVETLDEDFYDPNYKIYTAFGIDSDDCSTTASNCGTYETVENSTPSKRSEAYKKLLANLKYYGLIGRGENTSDITSLDYYKLERRSQYESAFITKLTESFEEESEASLTTEWAQKRIEDTVAAQKDKYSSPSASSDVESALDSVSDTNFVFYAPDGYGFVINILLPFDALQSQDLEDAPADYGDPKGNKFVTRASLLKLLTATDQRKTWFTGHDDFSYVEEDESKIYKGGDSSRQYLFFENTFTKSEEKDGVPAQYSKVKNYLGEYSYNGKVLSTTDDDGDKKYSFRPTKLTIDGFISELEGYLGYKGFTLDTVEGFENKYPNGDLNAYCGQSVSDYYKDGDKSKTVDYTKFVYYEAKISEFTNYDSNKVFDPTSRENLALSIINELSFAYNTDTAGLNSYLGYAVTPNKTDYVNEFEYAAQEAVRKGAGTVTIAPSDYGWHIMYCTFSYSGNTEPYRFDPDDIEKEGTFSYLYYEALKADNFSTFSSNVQRTTINGFNNATCVTRYVDRYSDLWED